MDYEYDVFLSYKSGIFGRWLKETFYDLFKELLAEELGKEPKIFYDSKTIETGDEWELRLKRSLADSRCLVAIWSCSYFSSKWCCRELNMMRQRERLFGFRTDENPDGLILPIRVHDGDSFPGFAHRINWLDCSQFARVGEAFQKTERYIQLQDSMFLWMPSVVKAIRKAPTWSAEWRTLPWEDGEDSKDKDLKLFEPPRLG